jgi:hypothetical protein
MADINLTEGDDTFEHEKGKPWANIRSLGGKDKITIHGNANVVAGAGDDTIINDAFDWVSGGVAYWDSPASIYADLEAGYVLDGYGGRDTLINIRSIHTSGRNGDVIFGSAKSDDVWLNGFKLNNNNSGSVKVDMMGYRNLRYPLKSLISFK